DKKIFNVSEDLTTQGGTALDALKNIPSIQVDLDGNVSLRGSQSVKILVDGKPFGLEGANRNIVLQQIPANSIESIELITNPSAKYNPEGTSGILNIILKKNSEGGYNGNLTLNAGTRDKYNGSINLNYKKDKYNIFGSYSYSNQSNKIEGSSFRQNLFSSTATFIDQLNSGLVKREGHLIKGGIDYSFNKKSSLGFAVNFSDRNSNRSEKNENKELDSLNNSVKNYFTNGINTDEGINYSASVNFNTKFKNPRQTLSGEISYSKESEDEISKTEEVFLFPKNNTPDRYNDYQKDLSNELNMQLDYVHPFGKDSKIETGLKSTYEKNDEDFLLENYDYVTNTFVINNNVSNNFIYKENVQSLYAIYQNKISDFSYSLGLRGEYTNTTGVLKSANQNFENNYFTIFPSASFSQKLSLEQELQLTYSRRINRPGMRNLNPFPDLSDPLNIRIGNPALKPEYTNSLELSYINYFKFATVTPSIFFRQTDDEISRYRTITDSNTTITTFKNLNSSKSYGLELIVNSQILKWWNVTANFSYYKSIVDAQNISSNLTNETNSWSTRLSTGMNIPDLFDFQLSYFYTGKRISANSTVKPMQSLDAAIKKDFFDRKMSVSIRVSDIFNTMKFKTITNDPAYIQESFRRRNSRAAYLTLTFNIGSKDKNNDRKKRRNENEREPDMNDDF
ncbi:MAG: outer membrane beta-barrel family protein, partial [Ignavibacteria bacterium]